MDGSYADLVDPFIGTDGVGFGIGSLNPGPQLPFSPLRAGPDTTLVVVEHARREQWIGFEHFGGYFYKDTHVRAFSQTHLVGAGVNDFGNIGIMPHCHRRRRESGSSSSSSSSSTTTTPWALEDASIIPSGYRAPFEHSDEDAHAGYYSVQLGEPASSGVEITPTGPHSVFYQINFDDENHGVGDGDEEGRYLLFDLCHSAVTADVPAPLSCLNATVAVALSDGGAANISGSVLHKGSLSGRADAGGVWIHFHGVVESGVESVGVWANGSIDRSGAVTATSTSGSLGGFLKLLQEDDDSSSSTSALLLKVGISFVSQGQAQRNLDAQARVFGTFDDAHAAAVRRWNHALSSIAIGGDEQQLQQQQSPPPPPGEDELVKFYTALYNSMRAPTRYSEEDRSYVAFDNQRHVWEPNASHYYSDMSLWDIHRTQLPLLGFLGVDNVARDVVRSLIDMFETGGVIPRWPLANVYTGCMVGSHGSVVIADIAAKDAALRQRNGKCDGEWWDYDLESAFAGMRAVATAPQLCCGRVEVENYTALGFVPLDREVTAASLTLSYALDDSAVATVAALLGGHEADVERFTTSAQNYRNLWAADSKLMCARFANGTLVCPSEAQAAVPFPLAVRQPVQFVEGDGWQWLWFTPHDPEGLVSLFEEEGSFAKKLDEFFQRTADGPWSVNGKADVLPAPFYWAGNEPDLFAPWLFAFANRSDLSQKWTRWLIDHKYTRSPDGLPGNDDFGTMSAWYVFAACGFYPQSGTTRWILGSPSFSDVSVRHEDGLVTRVIAHNVSSAAVYVSRVELNGVAITNSVVEHADLVGGVLEFWMKSDVPTR